jgi:hypothetical protein
MSRIAVVDQRYFFSPLLVAAGFITLLILLGLATATPFWTSKPMPARTQPKAEAQLIGRSVG